MLLRSLQALQADGKAEVISMEDGKVSSSFESGFVKSDFGECWVSVLSQSTWDLFGLYITLRY